MSPPRRDAPPRNVHELLFERARSEPRRTAFVYGAPGRWRRMDLATARGRSMRMAAGLRALGIEPGARMGLLARRRIEWTLLDAALSMAGLVSVPIPHAIPAPQVAAMLLDSGATACIVEDPAQLDKVAGVRDRLPALEHLLLLDEGSGGRKEGAAPNLNDVLEARGDAARQGTLTLEAAEREAAERMGRGEPFTPYPAEPEDLWTIAYTPGSSCAPKGVMLSHDCLLFASEAAARSVGLRDDDRVLILLPLSHVFGRVVVATTLRSGARAIYVPPGKGVPRGLEELHPTVVPAVPHFFEKVHERCRAEAEREGGVRRQVFDWAFRVGRGRSRVEIDGREASPVARVQHSLAHRLVFSRVHQIFGGKVRTLICGGAPLASEVGAWFHAAGLPVLEGYGLTESTAIACLNRVDELGHGTVGAPVPGVELRLTAEGEILLRGRNVMKGYFERKEATREVLDPDGWLHTGDIGALDDAGRLRITRRKKDLIVTADGRSVVPSAIESRLVASPHVEQAVVFGEGRPFLSALITLAPDAVGRWARDHQISFESEADLSENDRVHALIDGVIQDVSRGLAPHESIRKFAILPKALTEEDGTLTLAQTVRRLAVEERYRGLIESFYSTPY